MGKAWIVTDLGFGDAGKGGVVSALTANTGARLVTRFNGGAQAAHTVLLGGVKHTFHQFGAGSLQGARTLLSRFMLVNPISLWEESRELETAGVPNPLDLVAIDPRSVITTPYHVAANRLKELCRRHGSCGLGIGECVEDDLNYPDQTIRVEDVFQAYLLSEKLAAVRARKGVETAGLNDGSSAAEWASSILKSDDEFDATCEVFQEVLRRCQVRQDAEVLEEALRAGDVILEGAQGVLLDQDWGFHPHTTWSNTTTENARELIPRHTERESVGVMRTYQTRHGAGPFPTQSDELTARLTDPNNPANEWQGSMRAGYLDLVLTRYAIAVSGGIDSLAISCLDQIGPEDIPVVERYAELADLPIGRRGELEFQERLGRQLSKLDYEVSSFTLDRLSSHLALPVRVESHGPETELKRFCHELRHVNPRRNLSRALKKTP